MKYCIIIVLLYYITNCNINASHQHPNHHHLGKVFQPLVDDIKHVSMKEVGNEKIYLVESLPIGDFDLKLISSETRNTWEVLIDLVAQTKATLDISAMYWNLLGIDDYKRYNNTEMKAYGASHGHELYKALQNAAYNGVKIRIITSDFDTTSSANTSQFDQDFIFPYELQQLVQEYPQMISVHVWSAKAWYESGILHQKLWIFDEKKLYVGSANMDWKSLTQVMELGIVVENHVLIVKDMLRLFETWWLWTLSSFSIETKKYFSMEYQAELQVPSWSKHLNPEIQRPNPFQIHEKLFSLGNISHPISYHNINTSNVFIAASPPEILVGGRTNDEDALIYTIRSAHESVCLSVMDYYTYSKYSSKRMWWPVLNNALLSILTIRPVHIRLLISQWQHTTKEMIMGLKALQNQVDVCKSFHTNPCKGDLKIRFFRVPGWNETNSTFPKWPAYSRVNHAKYIVTDNRVNIGTSNMIWGYFHNTAGISFNTNDPHLRNLTQAIFNRNWYSSYTISLHEIE